MASATTKSIAATTVTSRAIGSAAIPMQTFKVLIGAMLATKVVVDNIL
jgi:hypothetical protein